MDGNKYNIPELLGKNIQKFRKERGLTQEQLSEKLDITQKHLSIIENGNQFASASLISRLCEELDVSPAELFGEDLSQKYFDKLYARLTTYMENKLNQTQSQIINKIEKSKL